MQPLVDLVHCFCLYAVCAPCGRMERLAIPGLILQLGEHTTVSDVRLRLRRSACGERRQDVRVVYVGPDQESAGFGYRQI